jgi:hypothetical protein
MVRTQIQLTNDQARRLRTEARERGISLAVVLVSTEHRRGRLMVILTV